MILSIVALVIQLLPGILSSVGVISPALGSLITNLGAAIPGLITSLSSGQSAPAEIVTILEGIQAELKVLQAQTTLDSTALSYATMLDAALTSALTACQQASVVDDPSTLTSLPTDL